MCGPLKVAKPTWVFELLYGLPGFAGTPMVLSTRNATKYP